MLESFIDKIVQYMLKRLSRSRFPLSLANFPRVTVNVCFCKPIRYFDDMGETCIVFPQEFLRKCITRENAKSFSEFKRIDNQKRSIVFQVSTNLL